ncbi:hypothetical protein PSI22_20415, partial [Xenorhabdus sp. XENO-7]|nr:hypothetical protein [Xenorhabdus aichiensis]
CGALIQQQLLSNSDPFLHIILFLDNRESNLMSMGITEVGLRVAPNNPIAKALYEKSGFHITGFNMSKTLS